jgi:hypothetical protein
MRFLMVLTFAINGEKRGFGVEAVSFQPEQLFCDCSAIDRD